MKLRTALVLVGVLVGLPSQAAAQVAGLRPAPSVLFGPAPVGTVDVDSLNIPPTYWKEGALIGGGAGALFGGWFAHEWCTYEGPANCAPSMLWGAFWGALIFAIPGAFIGGQFPKSE